MKSYFILVLLLISSACFAQVQNVAINLPRDFVRNEVLKSKIPLLKYNGSPYLNDAFLIGNIIVDNDKVYNKMLRFNTYTDEFEIQGDGNKITALIKSNNVMVILNGIKYKLFDYLDKSTEKKGYFVNLNPNSNGVVLLRKDRKIFIEAKKASSSYSEDKLAEFVLETIYFIKKSNASPAVIIKINKKSILLVLKDQEKALKVFIKANKLKLKKEHELVKLINYYNTL